MSICKGIAGVRGHNPRGIFMHNDAGSKNATAKYYREWLQAHDLSAGFAHYYVASDGTLQAEDDENVAWHCGQTEGNNEYLSIETCQSMGDLDVFKSNEEKALALAAQKCKQYGIIPSDSTIRLHQEVYATACPHRSVDIHGGPDATKAYFINRIKALMNGNAGSPNYIESQPSQTPSYTGTPGVNFTYAVRIESSVILPEVINLNDFAGIQGKRITDVAIKVNKGKIKYRVHVLGGGWLPWVTGCNWSDHQNGYAGNGKPIDAVQVYYETPAYYASKWGYQKAQYRVSPVNGNYWSWQYDDETGNGQDGYAGCYGRSIDRFQLF